MYEILIFTAMIAIIQIEAVMSSAVTLPMEVVIIGLPSIPGMILANPGTLPDMDSAEDWIL